jgi:hypothetical protein
MSIVPATRQPDTRPAPVPLEARHRWVQLLAEVGQLAHAIANTDFVPKSLRGNEAAIAAAILYGDEVGLTPMQSLAKIAVIDGKPALAAEAQRALILAAGHNIWFEEMTLTKVTVAGQRVDAGEIQRVTWTLDDARRAGLANKPNWRSYPRQMLLARASAELARAVFADAIGGLAATEELEDIVDATAESEPEPPAPTRRRRQTRARTTPAVVAPIQPAPAPDAAPEPPLPTPDEAPKASQAQLRKLFAMFKERGLTDRDDRLDWANEHLERTIVSASELTDVEASALMTALEEEAVAPPADTQTEASSTSPAAPAEADPRGARGRAAPDDSDTNPGQQTLGDATISQKSAEILLGMRRETGVDDAWMRLTLVEIGAEIGEKERITRTVLQRLTGPQANELQSRLNAELDARLERAE